MDNLSAPVIVAIGIAGSAMIAAFFAGLVTVISAWRTMAGRVAAIDLHVNGEKSALLAELSSAKIEIKILRDVIADKSHTAGLLAQAVATRSESAKPNE